MNSVWKNYKSTILILAGIIIGGLLGGLLPASATYLAPIGQIFMNVLFVIIVPMIFFSVSSAVCRLQSRSSLGRTLLLTAGLIIGLVVLFFLVTYAGMVVFPPFDETTLAATGGGEGESRSFGELIVDAMSVNDFTQLFSIRHILPLIVISLLAGVAAARMAQKRVIDMLDMCNRLTTQMMDCLMVVAPIGLGCYFADMTAHSANMIITGFGRVFGLYIVLTVITYCVINPLTALIAGVPQKTYWRNMIKPSLLAVSTLSSSACIPANIEAAKGMGCDHNIAEAIVPLGTQLYKQGSVISCATKVAFVIMLYNNSIVSVESALVILGVSLLASVIVGAVPTGAGTAELFICSILGADPQVTGLLIILSTMVDIPGTLLNVNGNTLLPLIVNKVMGKGHKPELSTDTNLK